MGNGGICSKVCGVWVVVVVVECGMRREVCGMGYAM